MKIKIFFPLAAFLLGVNFILSAQSQTKLNGTYIASKVDYLSGEDLPDDNILKYTYVKYTFLPGGELGIAGSYEEKNLEYNFEVKGNRLLIKTPQGTVINTLKVMESNADKLVLISGSATGALDEPKSIRYTLYNEHLIQNSMPLTPNDIFSIRGNDTTFKSGQKIYAQFEGSSFQGYLYKEIAKKKLEPKDVELVSVFIVDENGKPDSVRILKGISAKYDAEYMKAFNTAKNLWKPAIHNGRKVKVQMQVKLKYLSMGSAMPSYFSTQKANAAYGDKDYELALYYFDEALLANPDDVDNLYRRGICKQMLGNIKGACIDWQSIRTLGKDIANELLTKYCK